MKLEADSIQTYAILTNAILTEIHVDTDISMIYIHFHQRATISCVMEYDFAMNITIMVFAYSCSSG